MFQHTLVETNLVSWISGKRLRNFIFMWKKMKALFSFLPVRCRLKKIYPSLHVKFSIAFDEAFVQTLLLYWLCSQSLNKFRSFGTNFQYNFDLETTFWSVMISFVALHFQSECRKIRIRKTLNTNTFHAVNHSSGRYL